MSDTAKATRAQTEREADIKNLRQRISTERSAEAVKRQAADNFVEECKANGLNPITGTSDADRDAFFRIDKAYKDADAHAELAVDFEQRLERLVVTTGHEADSRAKGDLEHPEVRRALSLAEQFVASEAYRQMKRSGGLDSPNVRVNTSPAPVADRDTLIAALFPSQRAHLAALDVDALIPTDQSLFPPQMIPQRTLKVRDLVNVTTTDTDTIEYVVETTHTDAVVETSYGVDAPESTYEYDVRSTNVKRLPHFVKATRGQLADQGQLRGLLDRNLIYGVGKRLDDQMVKGTGAGDNLRGILEAQGLGDVDGTFGAEGAENAPDAFHLGITAVRLTLEDDPTAFLLHPDTYQQYVLAKGQDGHYLNLQGPQSSTPASIWGLPAVVSTVISSDSALVGHWNRGATLWVRSGITVMATDSDATDFRKGIITILSEMRAAFAVVEPKAFCEITNIGVTA